MKRDTRRDMMVCAIFFARRLRENTRHRGGTMQKVRLNDLDHGVQLCCMRARDVRSRAHEPYSKFKVGCAVRGGDGNIHIGVNVENAAYPMTRCAEGNAISGMVGRGVVNIDYLVIALKGGGSPCGGCRQIIWEFSHGNKDLAIYCFDAEDKSGNPWVNKTSIGELLPYAFEL